MTWFRVDDGFPDHPKLEALESSPKRWAAAVSLWLTAGCDCAARGTDGVILTARLARVSRLKRGTTYAANDLVRVGLWRKGTGEEGDFYAFNDWADYNPTAAETKRKRELANERQRRKRANVTRDVPRDPSHARAFPGPARPDPSSTTPPLRASRSGPPQGADPSKPAKAKRGCRLPDDWAPKPTHAKLAAELGVDLVDQAERFGDYWRGLSGAKATKLDWDATFRNWLKRAADYAPRRPAAASGGGTMKAGDVAAQIRAHQRRTHDAP